MNTSFQLEPIVAIATPIGESAIAIVRMSGNNVFTIADYCFKKKGSSSFSFQTAHTHTAHYGVLVNKKNDVIDEVLAIVFRSPKSYTMEDSIEFNCHGGAIAVKEVMQTLIEAGCRLAEPGEFTKRAFLNGRLDLTQVEAIGELIHAKSESAYHSAITHLQGTLSTRLFALRDSMLRACAMLELELDFSEEDVVFQNRNELQSQQENFEKEIQLLLNSFRMGKIYAEGIKVAIVGKANTGKSTLLNKLLGKERAIVSNIAGTTRDFIQEYFVYDGIYFQLIDTAGLRFTSDKIEAEGIRRSKHQLSQAEVALYMLDISTCSLENEIKEIQVLQKENPTTTFIFIGNKIDLLQSTPIIPSILAPFLFLSAMHNQGIDELLETIKKYSLPLQSRNDGSLVITNIRHYEALREINTLLQASSILIQNEEPSELIASCYRSILHAISRITGETTTDDILNVIFSKFCIGK